jgi:NADH-quinone oxidoreductase subunit L
LPYTTVHNASLLEIFAALAWLLPLASFFISLFTSERYAWLVSISASLLLLASAVCSALLVSSLWNEPPHLIHLDWFSIQSYHFSANILLNNQSILMLLVVSVISFLVHIYSIGYMAGDNGIKRYFAMLGFFTFSMQGIVLADSLLLIFIFWELVGFSSYMLIGHYHEKIEAGNASRKSFIMNRLGDAGFLIGLMIVWTNTNSFNLSEILQPDTLFEWQTAASLCIFCGVIGKSAQFPLFTWLPDAMEGPTPVSALIHAATMVAAGVYLSARIFLLFTPPALMVVACLGAITALIGSLAALAQYDIKKILAYSTISQLGLMMMAIGMGIVNAALQHLFTHAFFKACLFLSAGSVIHALHLAQQQAHQHFDIQDIRNLGGLRKKLPATFITFIIGGASLAGIPFFSGFLSKEAMLAALWMDSTILSWVMLFTIVGVSFLTVMYTFRMIWFVFMGEERNVKGMEVHEAPAVMRGPVILLAVCSLWFIVSWNPFNFAGWFLPASNYNDVGWITVLSTLWVVIALALSWLIFNDNKLSSNTLLRNGFYIDSAYKKITLHTIPVLAQVATATDTKLIDRSIHLLVYAQVTFAHVTGWLDRFIIDGAVHGIARLAMGIGSIVRSFQGGKIQLYIFWAIFAIIIFLIWTFK